MNPLDYLEKLINEHGSAAILAQQLAFAKDQFSGLERKVADLQTQTGRLEAKLEREQEDHKQARGELQRLKDEHAEEIRIHAETGVEFRRGKRTAGKWSPFCPSCHSPAASPGTGYHFRCQSKACGLALLLFPEHLQQAIGELG